MADREFDRTAFNTRERPLSSDLNQLQSQHDRTLRALLRQMFSTSFCSPALQTDGFTDFGTLWLSGFIGDSFKVRSNLPASMKIYVTDGYGFIVNAVDLVSGIGGVQGVNDLDPYKPVILEYPQSLTVPANATGSTRYDIVEVCYDRRMENANSRQILDPTTQQFVAGSVNKTLAFDNDGRTGQVTSPALSTAGISYKVGSGGTRPSVTPGYVKIADITVPNGATSIGLGNINDERNLLAPYNCFRVAGSVGIPKGGVVKPTFLRLTEAPPGVEVLAYGGSAVNGSEGPVLLLILAGQPSQLVTGRFWSTCGSIVAYALPLPAVGAGIPAVLRADASTYPGCFNSPYTFPAARPVPPGAGIIVLGMSIMALDDDGSVGIANINDPIVHYFDILVSPQMATPPVYPTP